MTAKKKQKHFKELWLWRLLFIIVVVFVIFKKYNTTNAEFVEITEDCIVKTRLNYNIDYDVEKILDNIHYLEENNHIKGVLLQVDSGGGCITASEALHVAFKNVKLKKPLVVSTLNVNASGAYMVSMSAHKIYAYETSAIGSIGVLIGDNFIDMSKFLENIGIKIYRYKSVPLKDLPNNLLKPTDEEQLSIQKLLSDLQDCFKSMLYKSRPQIVDIERVSTGEAFSGKRALELGLIDAIGSERDAMNDLKNNFNLQSNLPVINYDIYPLQENKDGFLVKIITKIMSLL